MASYLLVPGGWHGGWWFEPLAARLHTRGADAHALTLSGLDPENGGSDQRPINLDTHIDDVVALLRARAGQKTILCGHSYGGIVIAGAADRVPDLVHTVVYVDAYVPSDGDSCWSLTTDKYRRLFVDGSRRTGSYVDPPPHLDRRAMAHPVASFLQGVKLARDPIDAPHRKVYVHLSGWPGSPFDAVSGRIRARPDWDFRTLPVSHDVMAHAADPLFEILRELA